jgi:hypothetical protein
MVSGARGITVIVFATFVHSSHVQAQNEGDERDSRVELGFVIAPVLLNLERKKPSTPGKRCSIVAALAGLLPNICNEVSLLPTKGIKIWDKCYN